MLSIWRMRLSSSGVVLSSLNGSARQRTAAARHSLIIYRAFIDGSCTYVRQTLLHAANAAVYFGSFGDIDAPLVTGLTDTLLQNGQCADVSVVMRRRR
jgi:hypothetical protein